MAAAGAGASRRGRVRVLAAVVLAALGVAASGAAFLGIARAASASVRPVREASLSIDEQRFLFDRRAWRAVPIDDVFPPVYDTTAKGALQGSAREYTRIGVGPLADCRAAFGVDLVRLLSAHGCGPVLRVDYTDSTRTVVATVGLAVLGTTDPTDELTVTAATVGRHDDLRPKALAFPGTPAAGFGDAQLLGFHVLASPTAPFVDFAAVGFSDGRPASADPGRTALDQTGADGAASDLGDMASARLERSLGALWARASS